MWQDVDQSYVVLWLTLGKRDSSSTRAMMFMGLDAIRSRVSWLSTNLMCAHWMPSLSYSSCQSNMGGKTRKHTHSTHVQRIVPLHSKSSIAKCTTAQQWCHNKFVLGIMLICAILSRTIIKWLKLYCEWCHNKFDVDPMDAFLIVLFLLARDGWKNI